MQILRWLCLSIAAAAGSGGVGRVESDAPSDAVSAASGALPPQADKSFFEGTWHVTPWHDLEVSGSSRLLQILPTPGKRRLRSFLAAIVGKVGGWFSKDSVNGGSLRSKDRRLQPGTKFPCRPARRPGVYGRVPSIPPMEIVECAPVATQEIFNVNGMIVDISYGRIGGLEVLMIPQQRGPTYYIEVLTSGDFAHYKANTHPLKIFRDHSCLNREQWCFTKQVKPIDAGFLVVDRHRLIHYNYTWLAEGSTAAEDIPDVYVAHFGLMNANDQAISIDAKLKSPTAVAEYVPHNMSFISLSEPGLQGVTGPEYAITPEIPHAWSRLLFVTDTGNHRLVMLNASNVGQFDYLGQFGITGESRDNSTGFNWPWGVAVISPPWEGRYEPTYASVLVVDRRNHRLIKLNLGYPLMPCEYDASYQVGPLVYDYTEKSWMCRRFDKPRLSWSAEYGRGTDVLNRPRGLTDPTAVAVYKHYIVVCEVGGNAITMLSISHMPPFGFQFVTYFKPVQGVSLQGGMSVSPFGYVWYNYIGQDSKFYFTSMYLPENLRESQPPSRFEDFINTCINTSWYDMLIPDGERFIEHMSFVLNASVINWNLPDWGPNGSFVDIFSFNKSGSFDIELLERLVFNPLNISMTLCDPLPTPTPPPFFGGNEEGWVIDGKSQSEFTKRSGACRSSFAGVLITCCISALWLCVLSNL